MKKKFEIKIIENKDEKSWFDFFIDGVQLSVLLGIDRYDMSFCGFDLDYSKKLRSMDPCKNHNS